MDFTDNLLVTLLGWSTYFFLHSLFAADWVKGLIDRVLKTQFRYYRLIYSTLFIVLLLPLIWLTFSGMPTFLFTSSWARLLGVVGVISGIWVLVWAGGYFDQGEFMGIAQVKGKAADTRLILEGPYRIVRHPLYFGTLLLFSGLFLLYPTIRVAGTTLVVFTYLVIGSRLEERKLLAFYGAEYATYMKTVKGLIPWVI